MKAGTDSVLLGAWADAGNAKYGLDIGTGSGILSLMLAQRYPDMKILGLEIEENACREAKANFARSPWSDRLRCTHSSLFRFTRDNEPGYDFIISNPPYFPANKISQAPEREWARSTVSLTHVSLLRSSARLLLPGGNAAYIIPADVYPFFNDLAVSFGLKPVRITAVKKDIHSGAKRFLLQYRKTDSEPGTVRSELFLHEPDHTYSTGYRELVKDYLLDF